MDADAYAGQQPGHVSPTRSPDQNEGSVKPAMDDDALQRPRNAASPRTPDKELEGVAEAMAAAAGNITPPRQADGPDSGVKPATPASTMPDTPSQCSPVPQRSFARFGMTVTAASCKGGTEYLDPIVPLLEEMKNATGDERLSDLIDPKDLFQGCKTKEDLYPKTYEFLEDLVASDSRSVLDIGADAAFSVALVLPKPLAVAVNTTAIAEGWDAEALAQGLACITGWLEPVQRRLLATGTFCLFHVGTEPRYFCKMAVLRHLPRNTKTSCNHQP